MTAGESGEGHDEEPADPDSSATPTDDAAPGGRADPGTDGTGPDDPDDSDGSGTGDGAGDAGLDDDVDWRSADALPGDDWADAGGLPGGSDSGSGSDDGPVSHPSCAGAAAAGGDVDAASDGGAVAQAGAGFPDPDVGIGSGGVWGDGPEYDEEMPLADHIEEMVRRLGAVIVVMALVSVVVLPLSDELISFIWFSILGQAQEEVSRPNVYQPLALVLARVKVATLAGFVIALPVFVYQTYLFMRPGLYPNERRYYLAAVPTSLVLATVGVAFAFYLVLPAIFIYFLYYSQEAAGIAFGLTETFGLMLLLMGFFAVVFQIPLFIMLAIMMGLTDRAWLAARRLYFWGAFLGIAFLFSPDPTGMAPVIVAATMIGLFEGTLLLLRWTDRGKRRRRRAEQDPEEPEDEP